MLHRTQDTLRYLAERPIDRARTGQTPHRVIFRMNKARVRWFQPSEVRYAPVFISMPLINTWSIFDLLPGRSVIEKLLAAGVPVYLLDWGRPGPEDAERPLSYYIDETLGRCFDRARRHARAELQADTLDAIGYCVGGTFLTAWLARNDGAARSLATVATPIDFHASGRLAAWADAESFPLDDVVDGFGNFPADMMRSSFAWLRPSGQTRKWYSLWKGIDDPGFRELWSALEKWNGDNVDFPGQAYREYVRGCYFDNALMTGTWVLDGREVNLGQGTVPAHVIGAEGDHICPPAAAEGLAQVWGGPVSTEVISGGHVGICVGRRLPAALIGWLDARA